jgi:hypothetical protein
MTPVPRAFPQHPMSLSPSPFRSADSALRERIATLELELRALRKAFDPPRVHRFQLGHATAVALFVSGLVAGALALVRTRHAAHEARLTATAASVEPQVVEPRWQWTVEPTPAAAPLRAVWARDSFSFAVGDHGTVLFRGASGPWTLQESGVTDDLLAVGGDPVFAVGKHGAALWLDRDEKRWVKDDTGADADLLAVASWYGRTVAVGTGGTILVREPGGGWTRVASGTTADLRAIWYAPNGWGAPGLAYAVGDRGTILASAITPSWQRGATFRTWTAERSGTAEDLFGIAGTRDTIVVAGAHGTVLRAAPGGFAPWALEQPLAGALRGVATGVGPAGEAAFVAGDDGSLRHAAGFGPWSADEPPARKFTSIAAAGPGAGPTDLLLLGEGGREIVRGRVVSAPRM